jgi:hypothetical protein
MSQAGVRVGPKEWAFVLAGKADPTAILVLLDERDEAEQIAMEMRKKGHRVEVRAYPPN